MAIRTSSQLAGEKVDKDCEGGKGKGVGSGIGMAVAGKAAVNLAILSLKKLRKEEARWEGEDELGKTFGEDRDNRESRQDRVSWVDRNNRR